MATFIRRKLTKMLERDSSPAALTIQRSEGAITLNKREVQRYNMLFTMLDSDKDDSIGGQEGASFLRRSGLDTDSLRETWRLASGGTSKPRLTKEDFFIACKLIASTQVYGKPDMQPLFRGEALSLADFHYDLVPDVSVSGGSDEAQDISVNVNNPTQFGSGLDKHTRYQVTTTTSLPQFSRKEMTVWRRFSDFEWLHKRMGTCFPAAILPLFPAKKLLGNSDESFTRDRAAVLQVYVDKLAHHPTLNNSLDLLVFLDATDEGLEAAKRYIEDKSAEEAESSLVKGVDMMMNIATTGTVAPPLVLKADEAFVQSCASHGAALARLNSAVKTAAALDFAQKCAAASLQESGKALISLAEHERKNTTICSATGAAVKETALAAERAEEHLLGQGSGGAIFRGTGGTTTEPSADTAAAAAFTAHSATHAEAGAVSGISGMFNQDFSDPYGSFAGGAAALSQALSPGAGAGQPTTGTVHDMCEAVGNELITMGNTITVQLKDLDSSLYAAMRGERDREAELGEAIKRRDAAIDKVQEANGTLVRKKKAYQAIKPSDKDYSRKSVEASQAVEKAELALSARRDELDKMTELLKMEMDRVQATRRAVLVNKLQEYARHCAEHAHARAETWQALLPSVTLDAAAAEDSKENVATIARKAEAKARQASAAAKAKATGAAAPSGSTASGETPPAAAQAVGSLPPAFAGSTLMFGEEEGNGNVEL